MDNATPKEMFKEKKGIEITDLEIESIKSKVSQ